MKNFIIIIMTVLLFVGIVAGFVSLLPTWASLALVVILQIVNIITSGTILSKVEKHGEE